MGDIVSIGQEHRHTARVLELVYNYIDERFGNSTYGINTEYDVAIKLLARISYNDPELKDFTGKVERDINEMIISFSNV